MGRARQGAISAAVIAGIAAIVIALVGPGGDFPLSDDWSYAHAVRGLCERGELELLPWTGVSLLLQAGYGAVLCELFGFSFVVLRSSTLALAVLGAIGFYLLAREYRASTSTAALATVVVALDPLYVNLAFTFMTDVPFLAFGIWTTLAYVRGIKSGDTSSLVVGAVLCSGTILIRQHAIAIAAATAIAALTVDASARSRTRSALAAAGLPAAVFVGYHAWVLSTPAATAAITIRIDEALHIDPLAAIDVTFRSLEYLGLLVLPLVLATIAGLVRRAAGLLAVTLALFVIAALALWLRDGSAMFYLNNMLYDFGVGALTLRDSLYLGMPAEGAIGAPLSVLLTVLGTVGAAAITARALTLWRARHDPLVVLALASFAAMLTVSVVSQWRLYLDRHVLAVLPFAALLLLDRDGGRPAALAAWATAAALAWFAVAGTHDYMAWNRVRYAMLDALEARGVNARNIDGGVEYNGSKLAAELGTWPTLDEARRGQSAARRSWWWVVDDSYLISFRELEGYAPLQEGRYPRWLRCNQGRVLLLERLPADPLG